MLVTKRQVQEEVKVGDDIRIVVIGISGDKVELGVKAPRDVKIGVGKNTQKGWKEAS